MRGVVFEYCFPSDICKVKLVVAEIIKHLRLHFPSLLSDAECDLRLILSELLYNAVIHGNKKDLNKAVKVRVEKLNGAIICKISDEGCGFDHKRWLDSFKEKKDILSSEHGRGILLAASLTESFSFNTAGNEITFRKHLEWGADVKPADLKRIDSFRTGFNG